MERCGTKPARSENAGFSFPGMWCIFHDAHHWDIAAFNSALPASSRWGPGLSPLALRSPVMVTVNSLTGLSRTDCCSCKGAGWRKEITWPTEQLHGAMVPDKMHWCANTQLVPPYVHHCALQWEPQVQPTLDSCMGRGRQLLVAHKGFLVWFLK